MTTEERVCYSSQVEGTHHTMQGRLEKYQAVRRQRQRQREERQNLLEFVVPAVLELGGVGLCFH